MLLAQACPVCGEVRGSVSSARGGTPCQECLRRLSRAKAVVTPAGVDVCCALLDYEGEVRRLVAGLKYRNDRRTLAWLANGMAGLLAPPAGVVVTWAPTTGARRRSRGFDQAELLARAVARRWRVPCRSLLRRPAEPAQTGRSRSERQLGAALVMARRSRRMVRPIVVVDDVLTTGATLGHAAQTLRAAGAPWIGAVTAARTP